MRGDQSAGAGKVIDHSADAGNMVYRPLRRPWFGWGARRWRSEVGAWLQLAFLFVSAGASWWLMTEIVAFLAVAIAAGM